MVKGCIIKYLLICVLDERFSENEFTRRQLRGHLCCNRKTHRVAASPLFIVVDEYVVPGEGAHVEGVEGAEDPEEGKEEEGGDEDVQSTIQTAATFVLLLLLNLLLHLSQSVSVHLQLDVEDLALVLPSLDCSSDGQEPGTRVFHQKTLFIRALQGALHVHRHVDTWTPNALVSDMIGAQNLNRFIIRIDP